MSRFYGRLRDLAKGKSREATKGSGGHLMCHVSTWTAGIKVSVLADGETDRFFIQETKGSSEVIPSDIKLLGQLVCEPGRPPRWEPETGWESESGK